MKSSYSELRNRTMRVVRRFAVPVLLMALAAVTLSAKADAAAAPDVANNVANTYHVIYLTNVVSQHDSADILTDLRNMMQGERIFFVPSRNAISMMCTEHDFNLAQEIVADMSRGQRVFRLTYTFTGSAEGAGRKSVSVVVAAGGHVSLKQGDRIPLVTGGNPENASNASEQVQYLDVGLNIDASLSGTADDLVLHSKVTQSAVVPGKLSTALLDPKIHQTSLDDVSILSVGKPLVLGSIDIPGTQKQEQIEVTAEPVQ